MKTAALDYTLPPELIAQTPVEPRDASRLLVLDRTRGGILHRQFREIGEFLRAGDALVLNETRVIPARFFCRRASGGRIEAFFLHAAADGWHVLLKPSARLRTGEALHVLARSESRESRDAGPASETDPPEAPASRLVLRERLERGEWRVRPEPACDPQDLLSRVGYTPLPPYIRRETGPASSDAERYQTVYSREPGALAAPTAGLHFTHGLLDSLSTMGVKRAAVTLHVGLGTFAAIDVDDLSQHRMHAEYFNVAPRAIETLDGARRAGGRVFAVGTTAARTLESLAARGIVLGSGSDAGLAGEALRGETDIFLYPPYRFQNVDALITNFHLPGSTLLALVMALAGEELIRSAYAEAIAERYRFFSYGDAMLIL